MVRMLHSLTGQILTRYLLDSGHHRYKVNKSKNAFISFSLLAFSPLPKMLTCFYIPGIPQQACGYIFAQRSLKYISLEWTQSISHLLLHWDIMRRCLLRMFILLLTISNSFAFLYSLWSGVLREYIWRRNFIAYSLEMKQVLEMN